MQCGPCDDSTKKPNAGVGVAENAKSDLMIVQAERNTKAFQAAWSVGRAEKYEMDLGRGQNLMCYVFYGKSGGTKADKNFKNQIIEAIGEEIESEHHKPTLILGDFNAIPSSIRAVQEMIEQDQWLDVGQTRPGGGKGWRTNLPNQARSEAVEDQRGSGEQGSHTADHRVRNH